MCPVCIGAAWLIAGGVSSAGGVATIAWRSVSKRRRRAASAQDGVATEAMRRKESAERGRGDVAVRN